MSTEQSASSTEQSAPRTEDPRPDELRRATSLVLVNTGHGKGKSSAAFGVVMRAVARDWPVAVVQFLKSGNWNTGEEKVARQLGVDWWTLGEGFSWDSEDLTEDEAVAQAAFAKTQEVLTGGRYRLVVLDEISYPMNWGWIDTASVKTAVTGREAKTNVVLTGRDMPQAIIEVADTATEMTNIKHAYDQGIRAMRGIDF